MRSDRSLEHLYPEFREKVKTIQKELDAYCAKHYKGHKFKIIEGFRSASYQNSLYQKGRTKPGRIVTYKDGYRAKSNHQYGLAVDFWPFYGFVMDKNVPQKHWEYLGHLARKHGLVWGGDWKKLVDNPHIEWDDADRETYWNAAKWVKENKL